MTDKVLHAGKFIQLKLREADDYKYEYVHESRCDGQIVSILPYSRRQGILLRHEFTPCWGDGLNVSSITGGWEKSRHATPIDAVIEELREEAGIVLHSEKSILSVGTCRGAKCIDTVYHLFAVNLDEGYDEVDIEGDGSSLESRAHNVWYTDPFEIAEKAVDPLVYVIFTKMEHGLGITADRSSYK